MSTRHGVAASRWPLVWLALVAACGAESEPLGTGGTSQETPNGREPPPTGPDACVCFEGQSRFACEDDDTPIPDIAAWCAQRGAPCPDTLDVWRRCASLGALGRPGRAGYLLTECPGELTMVYYNFGFGEPTYWLYDASGALVGRGIESDTNSGVRCGTARDECVISFVPDANTEGLSPAAGDAGAAASGEDAPLECQGIGPGDGFQ